MKLIKNSQKLRIILKRLKYIPWNFICGIFPMNKEIILESNPDMTCNTYKLFLYMIEHGLNKDYKLTWMVAHPEKFNDLNIENVSFIPYFPRNYKEKVKQYIRCNRAAAIICSNRHRAKFCSSSKQLNVFLDHGSQLKRMTTNGNRRIIGCDYLLCQSKFFIPYNLDQYEVRKDQIFCAGLPRNDFFYENTNTIKKMFIDIDSFDYTILWVPTFRQHESIVRIDCDFSMPLGLPVLYNEAHVKELNEHLRRRNVLLVVKPHPAQNMQLIKDMKCSNIRFIVNDDLVAAGIQTNELLAQTDAMITDYSSIYYDYLLADKPIAITLDDYHEYENQKGFVFSDPLSILKGEYIYTIDDFITFINNVADGKDVAKDERNAIRNLVHDYQDGNSSERVYQFIIEHLKV